MGLNYFDKWTLGHLFGGILSCSLIQYSNIPVIIFYVVRNLAGDISIRVVSGRCLYEITSWWHCLYIGIKKRDVFSFLFFCVFIFCLCVSSSRIRESL
jgi:hypothetical protein